MAEISLQTQRLLTLSMLKGIGPGALRKIASVDGFEILSFEELRAYLPKQAVAAISPASVASAKEEADRQIEAASTAGATIISAVDSAYPALLTDTRDDPQILFVKGKLSNSPQKSVAIIGTREPTEHGRVIAQRLTGFFISQGWSVVSGLAIGCDAIAHEAALDGGGHTVAVMAHGLQMVAPSRHKKLAQRILDSGGALVSEYRFGQQAMPTNFVKRDRIQAGLAKGVVMVQSDVVGGSLHASRAAIDYGRWLAIPYPTAPDVLNKEQKVQANLLLADGTAQDRTRLLRCDIEALRNLIVLRGRDDYAKMIHSTTTSSSHDPSVQGQLF